MRVAALLSALLVAVSAIFQDEAYQVDYHHDLLGNPSENATFLHQPYAGSKASLIYTFTDQGAIGAINPKDGSLVWRHLLSAADKTEGRILQAAEGQNVVVSGRGREVNAWVASDGRLIWKHELEAGSVTSLAVLKNGDAVAMTKDSAGATCLDAASGNAKWKFVDHSGDVPLTLSIISGNLYYISANKGWSGGYKIRVTLLDTETGKSMEKHFLASDNEVDSIEQILYVGTSDAAPFIIWTNKDMQVIKMNVIGTDKMNPFETDPRVKMVEIKVLAGRGSITKPHALVTYENIKETWADVFEVTVDGQFEKSYTIDRIPGKAVYAVANVGSSFFFARVNSRDIEVYSTANGRSLIQRLPLVDSATTGLPVAINPISALLDVHPQGSGKYAIRVAVLLSTGDWILNQNGIVAWHRAEALVNPRAVVFATLAESQALARNLEFESHSNIISAYIHRARRHLAALARVPTLAQAWIEQVKAALTGAEPLSSLAVTDTFGFCKYIILATANSRLVAIDASRSGAVVWNAYLPESSLTGRLTLSTPEPGVIAVKVHGRVLHFDVATGDSFPASPDPRRTHDEAGRKLVKFAMAEGELIGFYPGQRKQPIWNFRPETGFEIKEFLARPEADPVASIGKVLGDRRVLYKYLNPNLLLVTAASIQQSTIQVYLLDSVSGAMLHSSTHDNVDITRPVASVVSENWLCYTFSSLANSQGKSSQGSQLIVAELYESQLPDDRGLLGAAGNYSSLSGASSGNIRSLPYVITQSFQIPEEISHMSVSQTTQGITNRMLMAVLPRSGSIVGIPRSAIDPRRVIGRDPTQPEMMEGLSKYIPVLDFAPQWILNHKREVLGVQNVIASPATLESTSLVFAYGHDIFGTRVTPSMSFDRLGKDFNKVQMLMTVAALAVAVFVVAPMVRGKQINARWHMPS